MKSYEKWCHPSHNDNSYERKPLSRFIFSAVESKGVLPILRLTYSSQKQF